MSEDATAHETGTAHDTAEQLSRRIDTSRAHPARVYDAFLGGKDHYPADSEAAKAALAANPRGYLDVRHNRAFLRRAVGQLAAEAGIRQFLDVGTGLPTQENVHQIAQRTAPESRVVYVDNDPVVLVHARVLLDSGPAGRTDYVDADLRDPATILREAARTLDFDRPVGLVLVAILHFVEDEEAYAAVRELLAALPSGSHLVLSHLTADRNPERITKVAETYQKRGLTFVLRPEAKIRKFLTDNGLEMIEPGLVPVHRWRPDHRPDVERESAADGGAGGAEGAGGADGPDRTDRGDGTVVERDGRDGLEDVGRTRYRDIADVTDADINILAAVARKP
ncbi:SAM-dependent methyltransferase [Streptomyces armeniacus]|uniref:SAM-dependent methyltransferase n=1 Tax=Streptomyces armeniacus TaxID=83291 RepID=A0A345XM01_9ACTN|nr:SAM-dependent methyltransferase [Streptomyces armeniacus]AXK32667.1 SAM-dependent methyltransferase [Streptomyces armeniacus]